MKRFFQAPRPVKIFSVLNIVLFVFLVFNKRILAENVTIEGVFKSVDCQESLDCVTNETKFINHFENSRDLPDNDIEKDKKNGNLDFIDDSLENVSFEMDSFPEEPTANEEADASSAIIENKSLEISLKSTTEDVSKDSLEGVNSSLLITTDRSHDSDDNPTLIPDTITEDQNILKAITDNDEIFKSPTSPDNDGNPSLIPDTITEDQNILKAVTENNGILINSTSPEENKINNMFQSGNSKTLIESENGSKGSTDAKEIQNDAQYAPSSQESVKIIHSNYKGGAKLIADDLLKEVEYNNKNSNGTRLKNKSSNKGSLAFVFDGTGSMSNDLAQLQEGAAMIIEAMLKREDKPIVDYVLVPFRDPHVGPVIVTDSDAVLKEELSKIRIFGGGNCPEKSLTGILAALNASRPNSYIYVFTDATADDHTIVDSVVNLVQRTHSQIVFILTGDCDQRDKAQYQVYEKIAAASSGQIFRLKKTEISKVLKFVEETLDKDRVNLESIINPPGYDHMHKVSVDDSLKQVTVSLSGRDLMLSIVDPTGKKVASPPKVVPVVILSEIKIYNINDPEPGNWTLTVGSTEQHSVKVTGLSEIDFDHGFSAQDTNKMSQTSNRPLEDTHNSLLISLKDNSSGVEKLTSVELLNMSGASFFEVPLNKVENDTNLFKADPFLPPSDFFYLGINGIDKDGHPVRRISSTAIHTQSPEKPFISLPNEVTANIHESITLQCKIESLVPISVWWFRNGVLIEKKQEHIQSAIVEHFIADIDESSEGKYICKASNKAGHSIADVNVVVAGSIPKTSMSPEMITAAPGETINLNCLVESGLRVSNVNIYFTPKSNFRGTQQQDDVGALVLSNQGMATSYEYQFIASYKNEGTYMCVAQNKAGFSQIESVINVLDPIKVEAFPEIMEYVKGDSFSFSCIIDGTTLGNWVFSNDALNILNKDISQIHNVHEQREITGNKLGLKLLIDITNSSLENEGKYVCNGYRGENEFASAIVYSKYMEAPSIIPLKEKLLAEEKSSITIECPTNGIPKPTIAWILPDGSSIDKQNGENDRISVDSIDRLVIHNINPVDDGSYKCRAENQFGVDISKILVTVWSKLMFANKLQNQTVDIYESISIPCNVGGSPRPKVSWYHDSVEILDEERVKEDGAILMLKNVNLLDRGTYLCSAVNAYDAVNDTMYLNITGLEPPMIEKLNESVIIKEGQKLELNCRTVRGKPRPTLYWQKDGVKLDLGLSVDNEVDYSEESTAPENSVMKEDIHQNIFLKIDNVIAENQGVYTCVAENIVGVDTHNFTMVVHEPPRFDMVYGDYDEEVDGPIETEKGMDIVLSCEVEGNPRPLITWWKEGIPVVYTDTMYTDDSSNLGIKDAKITDSGLYTCNASNPMGSVVKNYTVAVMVKPVLTNEAKDAVMQTIEGQLVVLPCSVYAVPAPQVSWHFNKQPLTMSDKKQIDSEYTLRFVANLTDSGVYQCEAINKAGNTSQEYLVLVFVPPSIYPKETETFQAKEGAAVVLDCHAIGFPKPVIVWSVDGQKIVENGTNIILNDSGRLNITHVSRNSSGKFICEAENSVGVTQKMFYVEMHEPPDILPSDLPVNIQLLNGEEEFNIPCKASGNPTPYVTWLHNGKYIINDMHVRVQADGTLTLRHVTEDLSGKYTCQAANTEGSLEIDYTLKVIAPPTLMETEEHSKTVVAAEGTDAILECPLKSTLVLPNIQWYKGLDLIDNNNQLTLTFVNVSRHNASEYSCLATNDVGKVSAIIKLTVHWPPVFVDFSEDKELLHLLEGDPMKLVCNVDANPEADVQWMKDLTVVGEVSPMLKRNYVKTHHAGEHICVATNPLGQATKKFTVHVSAIPKIDGPEQENFEVRIGQAMKLDCYAKGFPKPDIVWTGKFAPDWAIIGDGRLLKTYKATNSSGGFFACNATNKAGFAIKKFNVTVLESPVMPTVTVFANGTEEMIDATGNVSVKENSNTTIRCNSHGNPQPSLIWIRNGMGLVINDSGSINMTEYNFSEIKVRDSGKYTCLAKNKAGTEEFDLDIDVLVPPDIIFNETPNNIDAILQPNVQKGKWKQAETLAGQPITFNCKTYGNPMPLIYWFKDRKYMGFYDSNMMTHEEGQVLHVKKVSMGHAGNYTCVARNSVGEDKMDFLLDVYMSPFVEQQRDQSLFLSATKGQDVYLECPVNGNPKPTVRWLKHPYTEIFSGMHPGITMKEDNSTLVIRNVTVANNGNYSCIGSNIIGMTEVLYTVEVIEMPAIIDDPLDDKQSIVDANGTVSVKIRRGFQLTCNVVAHPEPDIIWLKDGYRIQNFNSRGSLHISLDGRYLSVMDANLEDAGKYVCNAQNKAGTVEKQFNVKVLIPAEWSPWSKWSECSMSCGNGKSFRTRECHFYGDLKAITGINNSDLPITNNSTTESINDTDVGNLNKNADEKTDTLKVNPKIPEELLDKKSCRGNHNESRECFVAPCKIDGGWSDWSEWTTCSVKCGTGSKRRYRSCSKPAPFHGGARCTGSDGQQEPCQGSNCSEWLPWSAWSKCSVTCGKGTQVRVRTCDGPADTCLGSRREVVPCTQGECQVDGGWGPWKPWSPCSASCGVGQMKRTRDCNTPSPLNGGKPCMGANVLIEKCLDTLQFCNKAFISANDVYRKGDKNKALLYISGKLNGQPLRSKYLETDILDRHGQRVVQTSVNDVISKEENYLPYMTFMVSPISMQGNRLDNYKKPVPPGRLRMMSPADDEDSEIQFATGEQVHFYHKNRGMTHSGDVLMDIIIDGSIPDSPFDTSSSSESSSSTETGCPIGFIFNIAKKECQDINECEAPTNGCHSTQMCENVIGSYVCLCQRGYMSNGMGQRCLDINECIQNSHECSHDCFNIPGSYKCACPSPLSLAADQRTCTRDLSSLNPRKYYEGARPLPRPPATPRYPKNPSPARPSMPDDDIENILLTRISPKRNEEESRMIKRKRRPHKYDVDNDYDYGVSARSQKSLSPVDRDEYGDYTDAKNKQRFSKHASNWDGHEEEEDKLQRKDGDSSVEEIFDGIDETEQNKISENAAGKSDDYLYVNSYENLEDTLLPVDNDCPGGFSLSSGTCIDVDECMLNQNSCDGITNICINTRGSHMCIPTPCPSFYKRNLKNGSCEQKCDEVNAMCSEGAALMQRIIYITFSTSARETKMPGAILPLYFGGKMNHTKYILESQHPGETFDVSTEKNKGLLHTRTIPSLKHVNRIVINSKTSDDTGRKLLYYNKYIIYLYISE